MKTQTPQLDAIEAVLNRQPQKAQEDGRYFRLWGWVAIAGLVATYGVNYFGNPFTVALVWAPLVALGVWRTKDFDKTPLNGSTRTQDIALGQIWSVLSVGAVLIPFAYAQFGIISFESIPSLLMLLVGLGMAITGVFTHTKPLFAFALFWFFASLYVPHVTFMPLTLYTAVCFAIGYLIPGYMASSVSTDD